MKQPALSIIIPVFNPKENWETAVIASYTSLKQEFGFSPELILVNDGSFFGVSESIISALTEKITNFKLIQLKTNNLSSIKK